MLPVLALALAPTPERIAGATWLNRSAWGVTLLLAVGFTAAGGWLRWSPSARAARVMLERGLTEALPALAAMLIAIGALFLASALVFRARRGAPALLGGLAALWMFGGWSSRRWPTDR